MKMFVPFVNITPTNVDISLEDKEIRLYEYGVCGNVLHARGHSSGSISVLLGTEDAFVKDLAMNALPLRLSPGLPILAENLAEMKNSWSLLLDRGAKKIYPAHGDPFSAEIIRNILSDE